MIIEKGKLLKLEKIDIHNGIAILPQEVKIIGSHSIVDLPDLKELLFSSSVNYIESEAISNTGIVELIIPEWITSTGNCILENNPELRRVVIHNVNLNIQGNWFNDCNKLTNVRIGGLEFRVIVFEGVCYELLSKKVIDVYDVFHIRRFKSNNATVSFLATKQEVFGIGETTRRAIDMCKEKYLTPNLIVKYKDITLDSTITGLDYKLITGACDHGVDEWLKDNKLDWDSSKTVRELLVELKDKYGYKDFSQFIADRYKDRAEGKQ